MRTGIGTPRSHNNPYFMTNSYDYLATPLKKCKKAARVPGKYRKPAQGSLR